MNNDQCCMGISVLVGLLIFFSASAVAADKAVVVPLHSTVGNATAKDVVMGKVFSSKTAGTGITGTLEQHPMGLSYTNSLGMTFNQIPAGTFTMGSSDGSGSEPEEPGRFAIETQHQVTLSEPFYLQNTEVTNKQWNSIIFDSGLGSKPSQSHTDDAYPVESVNWYEAVYFANRLSVVEGLSQCYTLNNCNAKVPGAGMVCDSVDFNDSCTGYRLPTEAQWEYAARASTTTAYANPVNFNGDVTESELGFNENLHAMGWYAYNNEMENNNDVAAHEAGTKPVAVKQPNAWGLYDMHGNVWEWCQDLADGSDYSSDPVTDPVGDTGEERAIRSGSWNNRARGLRSANRYRVPPETSSSDLGFRIVLPAAQ